MDATAIEETVDRPSLFLFFSLPRELQHMILGFALKEGTSPIDLLCISPHLYQDVIPLLYTHVCINSKKQLHLFNSPGSASRKYANKFARSFTFRIAGVPGGATQGGGDSTPGSPRLRPSYIRQLDNRLLLTSKAVQLCPRLEHCTFKMFGVRHSSLLTSNEYINEEASAFRNALAGLKHLKSFSWTIAEQDYKVRGFSVAVVDTVFEPLTEGLEEAALDMDLDGRRILKGKGDSLRYNHPLESIALRDCMFPSDEGRAFFRLFTKTHPDDTGHLLFPRLQFICIRRAANVNPVYVAFLALFWQLQIDLDSTIKNHQRPIDWNPVLVMEDVYVGSIYGPRLVDDLIQHEMKQLVRSCSDKREEKTVSSNAYIRAMEESVEWSLHLDEELCDIVRSMQRWQQDEVICKACTRIQIRHIQGAVASYQ